MWQTCFGDGDKENEPESTPGLRASASKPSISTSGSQPGDAEQRNPSNESAAKDLSEASVWKLVLSDLHLRLVRLITGGKGVPVAMGKHKAADRTALYDGKLVRQVMNEYFDARSLDAVRADFGGLLDRIEAIGFLLGDVLGVELLNTEARSWADKALARMRDLEKKKPPPPGPIEKLRSQMSAKKAKARKAAAEKGGQAAAGLEKKLADIDTEWTAALVEIWSEQIEFEMPPPRSKIVEEKPLPEPEPEPEPLDDFDRWDDDLEQRQAAADDAVAVQLTARIEYEAAQHREERALRSLERVELPAAADYDEEGWVQGYEEKFFQGRAISDRERARRQQLLERRDAARAKVLEAMTARHTAQIKDEEASLYVAFYKQELAMCQARYEQWHAAKAEEAAVREERRVLWAKIGAMEIADAKAAGRYHDFTLGVYYPPSTFATATAPESPIGSCGMEAEGGILI